MVRSNCAARMSWRPAPSGSAPHPRSGGPPSPAGLRPGSARPAGHPRPGRPRPVAAGRRADPRAHRRPGRRPAGLPAGRHLAGRADGPLGGADVLPVPGVGRVLDGLLRVPHPAAGPGLPAGAAFRPVADRRADGRAGQRRRACRADAGPRVPAGVDPRGTGVRYPGSFGPAQPARATAGARRSRPVRGLPVVPDRHTVRFLPGPARRVAPGRPGHAAAPAGRRSDARQPRDDPRPPGQPQPVEWPARLRLPGLRPGRAGPVPARAQPRACLSGRLASGCSPSGR